MSRKQKLELTWIGKEDRPKLEPRILIEQPGESSPAANGHQDNIIIHGDNLLALRAIRTLANGSVKCALIDPPYNTGAAFTHYDDGVEHSLWLSLMRDRIEEIHRLLSNDGSLWVFLDDNESHYFKVMCDEIFGRKNFVANVMWQKKYSPGNNEKGMSSDHDHILCWAKAKDQWDWNFLPRTDKQDSAYKNPDSDPRGLWKASDLTRAEFRERDFYEIVTPSGKRVVPATGRSWSRPPVEIERLRADNRLWFGPNGDAKPSLKRFLTEVQDGVVARTIWLRDDVGDNEQGKKEAKALNPNDIFPTPKPERVIQRILTIATKTGDLVLDSFAGSGTTGAVAHKMGRRWIMVELGEHAVTHIVPRMRKVVQGTDGTGITEAIGWAGGGGFRFYRLAPSLLAKDRWGNWVVSKEYNPAMLAEAMCKHMGFTYQPSQAPPEYWNHGFSSERDFIYVTTQALTHSMIKALSQDIGPDRHLLICCKAFSGKTDQFNNISVRRIPQAVLSNCEWGRDDYSLRVANLPLVAAVDVEEPQLDQAASSKRARRKTKIDPPQDLFSEATETES